MIYKKISILFLLMLIVFNLSAQKIRSSSGEISFFSEAPIEDIAAESKKVVGIINTQDSSIAIVSYIIGFSFDKKLMEEHFNENYMETPKYPLAKFTGKLDKGIDLSVDGTFPISTTGDLTIHGVTQKRTLVGTAIIKNGVLTITTKFQVKLEDHKIKIPSILITNIAEVIDVDAVIVF